jgi:hypothetical protein
VTLSWEWNDQDMWRRVAGLNCHGGGGGLGDLKEEMKLYRIGIG